MTLKPYIEGLFSDYFLIAIDSTLAKSSADMELQSLDDDAFGPPSQPHSDARRHREKMP